MDARRIIDANANRAREGLRTVEDAARFILNNKELSHACKAARHNLQQALDLLPLSKAQLIASRDTPNDVGTTITTKAEYTRASLHDVVSAAAKRTTEALRTIEEYAKSIDQSTTVPAKIETIRYAVYDIERQLLLTLPSPNAPKWKLCVLISEAICTHCTWQDVLNACIHARVDAIQLREKNISDRELLNRAQLARDATANTHTALVINDRPDIAALVAADALHLGQTDLPITAVRQLIPHTTSIGISATNIEQAKQALEQGADICGIGPTFQTTTKQQTGGEPPGNRADGSIAGLQFISQYISHNPPLPHGLAIGGINATNISKAIQAGADGTNAGIAVSAAVCSSKDPLAACEQLKDAFPR